MAPEYRNILLIQLGDIGDVVLTTPTIRAVKESCPAARVSILVRKPCCSLLANDPHLHEVIEMSNPRGSLFQMATEYAAFARCLRSAHYDLVIDLRTGDRGAIISLLTGAKVRVGRTGKKNQFWHRRAYNRIVHPMLDPSAHPGAAQSLCIVHEIGFDTGDSMPRLHISNVDRERALALLTGTGLGGEGRFVTINPFSRWKYKEWDVSRWAKAMDWLWEVHAMPTLLVGSSEEREACEQIIEGRKGHAFNLAGRTSLGELAAVLSLSTLHTGVDSAAPHIAAAVGTPTVTIHGPSDWRAWRIADRLHKIVVPAMDCVPCNRKGCDDSGISQCLEQLGAATVIGAIGEVLSQIHCVQLGE